MQFQKIEDACDWSLLDQNTVTAFQPTASAPKDATRVPLYRAHTGALGKSEGKGKVVGRAIPVKAKLSTRLDKYRIRNRIGKGASGKVYACEVACQNGRWIPVALKVIPRAGLTEGSKSLILSEVKVLKSLTESKFQHAIFLKEAFYDAQNCYHVTDLAQKGTLGDMIKGWSSTDVNRTRFIMAVLLNAIDGLHQRGIIHRDIKPDNIFFGYDGYPLIGDFGIARQFSLSAGFVQLEPEKVEFLSKHDNWDLTVGRCGTHGYMAPEILRGRPYSYGVDTFSLGVTFYQLLHGGRLPFVGQNLQEMINHELTSAHKVDSEDRERQPDAFELLDRLLHKLPSHRINVKAAKRHHYFRGIDWDLVETKTYTLPFAWSSYLTPKILDPYVKTDKAALAGERILPQVYDPDMHGLDIRTLPMEPREWETYDEKNAHWPEIPEELIPFSGPDSIENWIPPSVVQEREASAQEGGLGTSLLNSIPCPEDEEDEDYLDYDDPCIQRWAGGWKSTYDGRLGSSSSLSGLAGGDDDDMGEPMDVDSVGWTDKADEQGGKLEAPAEESGDTTVMDDGEVKETDWVLEWMDKWGEVNRSRHDEDSLVSTEKGLIGEAGDGHTELESLGSFDEDGNRITVFLHPPPQDPLDCVTVDIIPQPRNLDGLAKIIGLRSSVKTKRTRADSSAGTRSKKRVRFAMDGEEDQQAGEVKNALPISSFSAGPNHSFSWNQGSPTSELPLQPSITPASQSPQESFNFDFSMEPELLSDMPGFLSFRV